ncbi:MAG: InlB B-repeat-containing protein, partial [Coriobacteriia bacterium]|nr:InlB B-repeat-containing protein [Coriobacteriia bacterium]
KNTTDEVIGMPSSISAAVGFTVTIPADIPTRAGYTFVGWNSDTAGDGEWFDPSGSYVMGDENATLFAIWKLNIDIDDPNKMPDQPGKLGDTTSIIGLVTLLIASVTTTAISVKRNRKC